MLKVLAAILVFAFLFLQTMNRIHPGTQESHSYDHHSNKWKAIGTQDKKLK